MPGVEPWSVELLEYSITYRNHGTNREPKRSITIDRLNKGVSIWLYPNFRNLAVVSLNLTYTPEGSLKDSQFLVSRWAGEIKTFSVAARPDGNFINWSVLHTDDILNPQTVSLPEGRTLEYHGLGYNLVHAPKDRGMLVFEVERLVVPEYQSNFPEFVEIADIVSLTFPCKIDTAELWELIPKDYSPQRVAQSWWRPFRRNTVTIFEPAPPDATLISKLFPTSYESYP